MNRNVFPERDGPIRIAVETAYVPEQSEPA
ncbi:MAG: hypothetical protein RL434_1401, partial [Pseudomonadota bacterium]